MRSWFRVGLLLIAVTATAQQPLPDVPLRRIWADTLTDLSGAVSRDGRFLTFINWSSYDIELRDLVSGEMNPLTANLRGSAAMPLSTAFSPDGNEVAFTVGGSDSVSIVQVVRLHGGAARTVYRGPAARTVVFDWTPDGQRLVVGRSTDARSMELGLVNTVDGTFVRLVAGRGIEHARVSRDGRLIVFEEWSRENPSIRNIRVLPVAGGNAVRVVTVGDDWSPEWTPIGDGVLFISARDGARGLWRQSMHQGLASGPPRRLMSLDADMAILGVSDSGAVYLGREGYGLTTFVAEMRWPEGSPEHARAIETPKFRDARRAAFSSDGKHLAYMLKPRSYVTRPGWLAPGISFGQDGKTRSFPTRLTLRDAPEWSPDGKSLLFTVDQAGSGEGSGPPWTFWRLDVEKATYRQIATAASAGLLRMVGLHENEIIYKRNDYSKHPAVSAIEAVNLRTGTTRQLYESSGATIASAALSNRGDRIAIAITDSNGVKVAILSLGSELKQVARLRRTNARAQLTWFQNDQSILISGQLGNETGLWRIPTDGSTPQKLQVDANKMTEARLSPDGKYLAYTERGKEPNEIISFLLKEISKPMARPAEHRPYNEVVGKPVF
jgi:Tol biopolymer transport system component